MEKEQCGFRHHFLSHRTTVLEEGPSGKLKETSYNSRAWEFELCVRCEAEINSEKRGDSYGGAKFSVGACHTLPGAMLRVPRPRNSYMTVRVHCQTFHKSILTSPSLPL